MQDGQDPAVGGTATASRWAHSLKAWHAPGRPGPVASALRQQAVEPLSCPTGQVVRDGLNARGTLLEVGCADGWFARDFTPRHRVLGVEENPVLAARARDAGVEVVERPWLECAPDVEVCDVALSNHGVYEVPAVGRFVRALHEHARRTAVVELSIRHPYEPLRHLFGLYHGVAPPPGPGLEEFVSVVEDVTGAAPSVEVWRRPGNHYPDLSSLLRQTREGLGLDLADDAELRTALDNAYTVDLDGSVLTAPVEVATVWWPTTT